jgi:hypothetical protein
MKTKRALFFISLACMTAAHGAPVLLGGFHGENETAQQSPSISDVSVTLARTGASTDITQGFSQVSTTARWGTQALDVVPGDTNLAANHAIFQSGTTTPITLVVTITNNNAADLSLDAIHWIVKKDIANVGPPSGTLTYASGSLSDAAGTGTAFAIANGTVGLDIALSGFLSDTTLASGESVVFTWAHSAPQDPGGNTALRMDNFAISGSIVDTGPDTDPPTPNPMTWASVPAAASDSSISMTATTATDPSGVEYYFTCASGGGNDSVWQSSASYTDSGLSPGKTYTYTVKARDATGLYETAASAAETATTSTPDSSKPSPDPMTFAVNPVALNYDTITMTATTATDDSEVEYYFTCTSGGGNDSVWQSSTSHTATGLDPETTYSYTVTARDKSTAQNTTAQSAAESATTPAVPVGPILLGGFDGSNAVNAPKQHSSALGKVSTELSSTATLNRGNFMQSSSPLWGTADLDPDAENTGTHNVLIFQNGFELTITVTNTSPDKDVSLDTLHWISKRDSGDSSEFVTITYTSDSLPDTQGTTNDYFMGLGGTTGHDYDLSNLLTDTVLRPGETATFTWVVPLSGNGIRLDNVALSGTVTDSDYISWSSAQGWTVGDPGTGDNDDYDLDGLSNEMERLFGLDPMSANSRNPITTALDPASGTFSYTRRTQSLIGMDYPVWVSTDLEEWFRDFNATQTPGPPSNDVETVDVEISPALLTEPKLFLRMGPEFPVTLSAPELVATRASSNNTVSLLFNRQLHILGATDAGNFTVELDGGSEVTVTAATLSADKKTVVLTLGAALSPASFYNVNFSNLTGSTGVPFTGSSTAQIKTWDNDPTGIKVFILAGQSNMVGYGHAETGNGGNGGIGSLRYLANNNASYPEYDYTSLLETPGDPANSAWKTRGNIKVWGQNGTSGNLGGNILKGDLGPFYGATNATAPDTWFGPEYAFGQVVGDFYASDDVLIIKTAWGGHSLHGNFRPPSAVADRGGVIGASYLETFKNAHEVLDNLGTEFPEWAGRGYQIVGFAWHQGVSDSGEPFATEHKENLPDFIGDVRAELGKPNLPFVIATTGMLAAGGPVESSPYSGYSKVEKAQLWVAGVAQPDNTLTDDTRGYWEEAADSPRSQGFHWNQNARSYFRVGKGLGEDMVDLLRP